MYKILVFISILIFSTGAFAQKTNDLHIEKAKCLISASASFELIALNALPSYKQSSAGGQEESELGLLILDAATLHGKIFLLAGSTFKNELSDVVGNQLVRDIVHAVQLFKTGNSEISKNSKELLNKNGVNLENNVEKAEEQLKRYLALLN